MSIEVPYVHNTIDHNMSAPGIIVPELVHWFQPASVLDVGCGIGTFLCTFLEAGVPEVRGVDGEWLDRSLLLIPKERFTVVDLEKPIHLGRKFDMALCLEVAEHLAPESADNIVDSLCEHADTIVFSAAIPGQGGQNHVNEQPFNYWKEKFEQRGFHWHDVLRRRYWNETSIEWWYKQNIFLVTRHSNLPAELSKLSLNGSELFIHPELWQQQLRLKEEQLQAVISELSGWKQGNFTFRAYMRIIKKKAAAILGKKWKKLAG